MNVIQIDSGSKNDHVSIPFRNVQPNHIRGKKYLYIFKQQRFIDYIVAECISHEVGDICIKPLYGKRVNFKNISSKKTIKNILPNIIKSETSGNQEYMTQDYETYIKKFKNL